MPDPENPFASRGGLKLRAALEAFALDVTDLTCADFGANVGGFTDCLLQRGAAKVYAVDTGYGVLAWRLRKDPRVVVMERTNALHCDVPEAVDLVVADMGWTPQRRIVPAAATWLKPGGRIVSLLKPHYELAKLRREKPRGPLDEQTTAEVRQTVCDELATMGFAVSRGAASAISGKGGNTETLLLIEIE